LGLTEEDRKCYECERGGGADGRREAYFCGHAACPARFREDVNRLLEGFASHCDLCKESATVEADAQAGEATVYLCRHLYTHALAHYADLLDNAAALFAGRREEEPFIRFAPRPVESLVNKVTGLPFCMCKQEEEEEEEEGEEKSSLFNYCGLGYGPNARALANDIYLHGRAYGVKAPPQLLEAKRFEDGEEREERKRVCQNAYGCPTERALADSVVREQMVLAKRPADDRPLLIYQMREGHPEPFRGGPFCWAAATSVAAVYWNFLSPSAAEELYRLALPSLIVNTSQFPTNERKNAHSRAGACGCNGADPSKKGGPLGVRELYPAALRRSAKQSANNKNKKATKLITKKKEEKERKKKSLGASKPKKARLEEEEEEEEEQCAFFLSHPRRRGKTAKLWYFPKTSCTLNREGRRRTQRFP